MSSKPEAAQASIASHASIYAIAILLRNVSSFVMLPIYTRFLTPADYGTIELLGMVLDILGVVFGMRIGDAVFRFYCTETDEQRKSTIISTAVWLSLALNVLAFSILALGARPISVFVFGGVGPSELLTLFGITMVLSVLEIVPLTFIRAQQKPWLFLRFSLLKLVCQVILNILFIVVLEMGVAGFVYSALLSGLIMASLLGTYTAREVGFGFARDIARRLVTFSFPLLLAGLGAFYITFGDRYFLRVFSGLSEVGIYSLGYKFGFLLVVVTWMPFQQIWDSHRYKIARSDTAIREYGNAFFFISFIMIAGALGLSLFSIDALRVMSAPEFWGAANFVPIVVLAYLCQSWTNFCRQGLLLSDRTTQIALGSLVGVIVISIGYLTLIPRYGGYGAAFATLFAFAARLLWEDFQARKSYDMQLPWWRVVSILGVATFLYLMSLLMPVLSLAWSLVLRTCIMLIFLALIWFCGVMSADHKAFAKEWVTSLAQSVRYKFS